MSDNWHDRCPRCAGCGQHRHGGDCREDVIIDADENVVIEFTDGTSSIDLGRTPAQLVAAYEDDERAGLRALLAFTGVDMEVGDDERAGPDHPGWHAVAEKIGFMIPMLEVSDEQEIEQAGGGGTRQRRPARKGLRAGPEVAPAQPERAGDHEVPAQEH